MIETLDLYVVDPDQRMLTALEPGLASARLRLTGSADNAEQVLPTLMSTCPDVVVLDIAACTDLPATVRKLVLACPTMCVIVTGAATPPATMSHAVASGARGFLIKPYAVADLFATIREAIDVRALSMAPATRSKPERPRGRVIAVYSPKGGVGTTTVATNLAVALAARPDTSVALVDLDLQFGDIGSALDLQSANSILEVLGHDEIPAELIDETFVKHGSGVRVLLSPSDLSVVESIDPQEIIRMIESLRSRFDYVVADLWSSFEALTIGVLRAADRVLMVTTPELPSLRDVQRVIQATRSDLRLADKLIVVANRYPGKTGLSADDMAKALGQPLAATIPSEGATVTDAINRGLSLLDTRARVRIARQYHQLAETVVGEIQRGDAVVDRRLMKQVTP